jgi:hypothetical protein
MNSVPSNQTRPKGRLSIQTPIFQREAKIWIALVGEVRSFRGKTLCEAAEFWCKVVVRGRTHPYKTTRALHCQSRISFIPPTLYQYHEERYFVFYSSCLCGFRYWRHLGSSPQRRAPSLSSVHCKYSSSLWLLNL